MNVSSARNASAFTSASLSSVTFNSKTAKLMAKYQNQQNASGDGSALIDNSKAGVERPQYIARARRTDEYRALRNNLVTTSNKDVTAVGDAVKSGSQGSDTLTVTGAGNKAFGSHGNETFVISGTSNLANGHQGDDTFSVTGSYNTISGGSDSDIIDVVSGTGNKAYGGTGDDRVSVSTTAVDTSVDFGAGSNDTLVVDSASTNYSVSQDGSDLVLTNKSNGNEIRISNDNADTFVFNDQNYTRAEVQDVIDNHAGDFGGGVTGTDNSSNSTINLTANNDSTTFTGYQNTINALDGDDNITIGSTATDNILNLGDGDDTVTLTDSADMLTANGGLGNDTFIMGTNASSDNVFNGGDGTDTLELTGNASDYTFSDNGNGTYTLEHRVDGGNVTISNVENVTFNDGTQTLNDLIATLPASGTDNSSNSTINLTANNDSTTFTGDNNTINALAGNDTLTNSAGATGNTYNLGDGDDALTIARNSGGTTVDGGIGTDTLTLEGNYADYSFTDQGSGHYELTDTVSGDVVKLSNIENVTFADTTKSIAAIITENTTGTTETNNNNNGTYTYTENNDTITVTGQYNTFNFLGGNDVVTHGTGAAANTYNLGDGNDTLSVMLGQQTFTADGGNGTDTMILEGNMDDYVFQNVGAYYELKHKTNGDIANFTGFENIQFADQSTTVAALDAANPNSYGLTSVSDTASNSQDNFNYHSMGGDDVITNNAGATGNNYFLEQGNDSISFQRGAGDINTVDGGVGTDTITLEGNSADYKFTDNGSGNYTLSDDVSGDVVNFTNVESFTFSGDNTNKQLADFIV